ncbi:unnamed protein product [Schistosoma margrebowiei]|uniref:Uncharacterized protein n=1 Tax=Schistosoma margrebowiei TaxID=48269 RepID=A0A183MC31_9TREM|nr:unnamed protein product [Schistosoma margrebowiei]
MKTSMSEGKHGMQWTARNQLEGLSFENELALLSHTHQQMQIETTSIVAASIPVGLNIHKVRSKILKHNMENTNTITLDGETLEAVESFT